MKVFGYNLVQLSEYTRDIILKTNEIRSFNNNDGYQQQKTQLRFVLGKTLVALVKEFKLLAVYVKLTNKLLLDNLCKVVTQIVEKAKAEDEVSFFFSLIKIYLLDIYKFPKTVAFSWTVRRHF